VNVAGTYNNMAVVFRRQGDYKKALEYYNMALKIRVDKLGHDHVDVANTQYNIALVHKSMDKEEEAGRLFLRCAEIYAQVYGADHSETLDAQKQAVNCGK